VLTIWKFPLETTDRCTIMMPVGRILTVQAQRGTPCIWALVDSDTPLEPRTFAIYGTGHAIEGVTEHYIGTYQMLGGSLVFHVFEITSERDRTNTQTTPAAQKSGNEKGEN
jgi:hypothetical protein